MSQWIYDRVREMDQERAPLYSLPATVNWFRALRFEMENRHGETPAAQFNSCHKFYRSAFNKDASADVSVGKIVEPLFFSVMNCMTLERMSTNINDLSWVLPTAIVNWYYAVYFSIRSIFSSLRQTVADDHAKSAKFLASTVRQKLPYPLNMVAIHADGETYKVILDGTENPRAYDLSRTFTGLSPIPRGMLAQYLNGTAAWYADRTKKSILLDNKLDIKNFRSMRAREIRDQRLLNEVGFLHCAFRQRVKANYRDSIYLAYNPEQTIDTAQLLSDLSATARFVSIAAMAFIERRNGSDVLQNFVTDLSRNLKHIESATSLEKFWEIA